MTEPRTEPPREALRARGRAWLSIAFLCVAMPALQGCAMIGGSREIPPELLAPGGVANNFVVREGDLLRIGVWPRGEFSGEFPIEDTGLAHLPGLGPIPVAGKTLAGIRAELRARYSAQVKDPVVTISPLFRVSVLGAVASPGLYRIEPTTHLTDLISMAGGFAANAREGKMYIVRQGVTFRVSGDDLIEGRLGDEAIGLRSGDRIIVPAARFNLRMARDLMTMANVILLVYSIVRRVTD